MFVSVLLISSLIAVTHALDCLSCDDVIRPEHCRVTATCSPDSMCMTQQVRLGTSPEIRYKLGCHSKRTCNALKSHSGIVNMYCIDCCDTEHCNKQLCQQATSTMTTTMTSTTTEPEPTLTVSTTNLTSYPGEIITLTCNGHHTDFLTVVGRGVVVDHSSIDYVRFQVHVTIDETIFCLGQTHGGKSVTKAIHISIKHSIATAFRYIKKGSFIHSFNYSLTTQSGTISATVPSTTQSPTTLMSTIDQHPYITTPQSHVTVRWGTPITISCFGHNVHSMNAVQRHTQGDLLTSIRPYATSGNTLLLRLKPQLNMEVICRGLDGHHVVASTSIHITVTGEKPYFPTNQQKTISLHRGENYTLNCSALGFPEPAITWHFVEIPGHYHINGPQLQLLNMNSKMAGTYRCVAHNYFGSESTTYLLQYIQPSTTTTMPPHITTPQQTTTDVTTEFVIKPSITLQETIVIPEGKASTVINCQAQGYPAPTVTWDTVGHHFPPNVQHFDSFLVIHNPGVHDSTYFICKAQNKAGTAMKVIRVVIDHPVKPTTDQPHIPPVITLPSIMEVRYGSSVTLTCNATGYPEPTITWHANHKTIRQKVLEIPHATMKDNELYICLATNDAGQSQSSTTLSVTGESPHISMPPTSAVTSSGSDHVFTCQANGVPVPTITWSYTSFLQPNRAMPQHKIGSKGMSITLTNLHDSGMLKCTATNPYGSVNAQANILMQDRNSFAVGK